MCDKVFNAEKHQLSSMTSKRSHLGKRLMVLLVLQSNREIIYQRNHCLKVKRLQRPGTEAIRTQIQPSKPEREITKITNSKNTKRTYGQPNEQVFPKRWPLSNRNRTKNNMIIRKVKRHRNSDTKNRQQRTTTKLPPWNGQ